METVDESTYQLIKDIQGRQIFNEFYLVVGTSLALQIGHRTSTDIDLFLHKRFDHEELRSFLLDNYQINNLKVTGVGLFSYIGNVKTDIVYHPCNIIEPPFIEEGVKLIGTKDIAAMN